MGRMEERKVAPQAGPGSRGGWQFRPQIPQQSKWEQEPEGWRMGGVGLGIHSVAGAEPKLGGNFLSREREGLAGSSACIESAWVLQHGRPGLRSPKIPGGGHRHPTPVFLPGFHLDLMDEGAWRATHSRWGLKEPGTTERLSTAKQRGGSP